MEGPARARGQSSPEGRGATQLPLVPYTECPAPPTPRAVAAARGATPRPSTSPTTTRSGAGRSRRPRHLRAARASRAFQSGLSWLTILRKRENFRAAFADFDIETVARFGERDVARLLADAAIVRHRGKIEAAIANARAAACARRAGWPSWSGRTPRRGRRRAPRTRATSPRSRPSRPRSRRSSSGAAFASSAPPPPTRRCRPAAWSTTTSSGAGCAPRWSASDAQSETCE